MSHRLFYMLKLFRIRVVVRRSEIGISGFLEVFVHPVCLHTIFLHYILPCPTILLRIN